MAVNGIQWNDLAKTKQVPSDGIFYRVGNAVSQAQLRRAQSRPHNSAAAPALHPQLAASVLSTCKGSRKLEPASIILYQQNKKWLAKAEVCFVVSNALLSLLKAESGTWRSR